GPESSVISAILTVSAACAWLLNTTMAAAEAMIQRFIWVSLSVAPTRFSDPISRRMLASILRIFPVRRTSTDAHNARAEQDLRPEESWQVGRRLPQKERRCRYLHELAILRI